VTYHELRAKAIKGPLTHRGEGTVGFEDGHCFIVYHRESTKEQDSATAALLAHCYNHFDKLVEALSELYDYAHKHTPMREFEGGAPVVLMKAQSVLAIAKEVK